MADGCQFCLLISEKNKAVYYEEPDGLFVAMWTSLPVSPGHTLVIPKRHIGRFRDMNETEMHGIASFVAAVKTKVELANLKHACDGLDVISEESKRRIEQALDILKMQDYHPPVAFNDGINDGKAAGQEVAHLHWHILPRWEGSDGDIVELFTGKPGLL
ncbi:MAG TPA: HIT family protein [Candidatus Saccharimonadia bacterium]|nr:HIT family protein [Candidatus Saccharimonadia bacterium]